MNDDQIMSAIEDWRQDKLLTLAELCIKLDVDIEVYKACRDLTKSTKWPKMDEAWRNLRHEWIAAIREVAQRAGVPGLERKEAT